MATASLSHGITPLPSKIDAIREFTQPTTVKGLQEFVGMVNFITVLYQQQEELCSPCKTLLLKGKNRTRRATMLAHPHANNPIAATVEASGVAVGVVLEQLIEPLAFLSLQLRHVERKYVERKYSAFDHDLLALYLAVQHFCYFLEGQALTDNKHLLAFTKVSDP